MAVSGCSSADNKTASKLNIYKKSMLHGAAIAGGFTAASTLFSNAINPDKFKATVEQYGGKSKYYKTLVTGLAVTAAMGAVLSTAMTFVSNKYIEFRDKQNANNKAQ